MPGSTERFPHGDGFFKDILEALPIPTFVVDADVHIIHANRAAIEFLHKYPGEILFRRGGEVLGCINSTLSPGGCGRSEQCKSCVIRGSVGESIRGGQVDRRKHILEHVEPDGTAHIHLLVTTSPLRPENGNDDNGQGTEGDGGPFALLMLEDITELIELRGLIPVCAWCKKVRDDSYLWQSVEEYFSRHYDLDFTHSICQECADKLMAEAESEAEDKDTERDEKEA
jgi:hypothetical protein